MSLGCQVKEVSLSHIMLAFLSIFCLWAVTDLWEQAASN